ncbi:MAG: glutathione S-transferase family protein [Turneriella sp.]
MKLYGSITSPFVRRVRFVCNEVGQKFELIDSLTEAGQAAMREKNPIWKVPCAEIDDMVIWDSHTIIQYLTEKFQGNPSLLRNPQGAERWREANLVSAADGCVESAINVFYLRKDGVKTEEVAYLVKQRARVESILTWLKSQLKGNFFTVEQKIGLSELTLYCILDWLRFREMYTVNADPVLKGYMDFHASHPSFVATKLPN